MIISDPSSDHKSRHSSGGITESRLFNQDRGLLVYMSVHKVELGISSYSVGPLFDRYLLTQSDRCVQRQPTVLPFD
jgi:hypothetical protein